MVADQREPSKIDQGLRLHSWNSSLRYFVDDMSRIVGDG